MQWRQKRDLYVEILKILNEMSTACTHFCVNLRFERLDQVNENLKSLIDLQRELKSQVALANIFASDDCNSALTEYFQDHDTPESAKADWAEARERSLSALINRMIRAARKDLSVVA